MSTRSILFTNLFLANRSGSELHVLELATFFKSQDWEVTCYTPSLAFPLQGELFERGIRVVEFGDEDQLSDHYDVLYAQHHAVCDYVRYCLDIDFGKIVVSVLSSYDDMEQVPLCAQEASLAVFVSEEAYESHKSKLSSDLPVFILPNVVDEGYFVKREHRTELKRVAVISNHVPRELKEAASASQSSVHFDFFGLETEALPITPELICRYDAIITIGRTAQWCFASTTPLYCYDRFGGPGYLEPEEYEKAKWSNFSGRSNPVRLSSGELLADLIEGYPASLDRLAFFRDKARVEFRAEKLYMRLLQAIEDAKFAAYREKIDDADKVRCRLLLAMLRESFMDQLGAAQLFARKPFGGGFSEESSVRLRYAYRSRIEFDLLKLFSSRDELEFRFDPDVSPCRVLAHSPMVAVNASSRDEDGRDCFYTFDPQYLVDSRSHRIVFSAVPMPPQAMEEKLASEARRANELQEKVDELSELMRTSKRSIKISARQLSDAIVGRLKGRSFE